MNRVNAADITKWTPEQLKKATLFYQGEGMSVTVWHMLVKSRWVQWDPGTGGKKAHFRYIPCVIDGKAVRVGHPWHPYSE